MAHARFRRRTLYFLCLRDLNTHMQRYQMDFKNARNAEIFEDILILSENFVAYHSFADFL